MKLFQIPQRPVITMTYKESVEYYRLYNKFRETKSGNTLERGKKDLADWNILEAYILKFNCDRISKVRIADQFVDENFDTDEKLLANVIMRHGNLTEEQKLYMIMKWPRYRL